MYTTVICQIFTFTRAYTVLLETLHVCMSGPRPLQRTYKTSRIFFKVCPSVSKKNHKFRVLAFIHHSIDAVIKAPRTNCLPAAVEVYIFSFMCSAEREREMQNVTMLLCTMAGIVERIRKRKEKREKSLMMWLSQVQALRVCKCFHTSSVNLLFLPESSDAGVSLLANVAV